MAEPAIEHRGAAAEPAEAIYEARLVPAREPFTCAISGPQGSAVALHIRHRTDAAVPPLLLDPAAVVEAIRDGMDDLDAALDHVTGDPADAAPTDAPPPVEQHDTPRHDHG